MSLDDLLVFQYLKSSIEPESLPEPVAGVEATEPTKGQVLKAPI